MPAILGTIQTALSALPGWPRPEDGRALWAELHRWALGAEPAAARDWLDRFSARIPCGPCRRHWLKMVAQSPPPIESANTLFAWTVALHNQVNVRLKKPEMSLDEARRQWTDAPPTTNAAPNRESLVKFAQWWRNRRRPRPIISALPPPPRELARLFDAAYCINLDADKDRWEEFSRQLNACDWPFCPMTRFAAIHGDTVGVPNHFHQGGGAWGCLQSHRRVLELSLMAGHQRILVLEDDADLRAWFGQAARTFFEKLGDQPWDCLMLGGQHMSTPRAVTGGVVQATNIQRTHCMAFSRPFMRALYRHWSDPLDQHCDWSLGPFAAQFRTFAPERFIVGQRGGKSWITGSGKPPEWWNPPPPDAPVIWLRCPRAVLESCRDIFHSGNRRNHDGVCLGLADVFDPAKNASKAQQISALKNWISMIQWEVESRGDGSVCAIWHPAASERVVVEAAGGVLIQIIAETETEAREKVAAIPQPVR